MSVSRLPRTGSGSLPATDAASLCRAAFWMAAVGSLGPIALTWVVALAHLLGGVGTETFLEPSGVSRASFVVLTAAPAALIHTGAVGALLSVSAYGQRKGRREGRRQKRHIRAAWSMVLASWAAAFFTLPWL